ncbi:NEDD4-binding protein 2 [Gastrophryne carolinensis]
MPRKRKSLSLSPQRKSSNSNTSVSLPSSASLPLPPAMSHKKKETLSSMCEMFPNLDPSLVEMVLSEYTEVEVVMDYLLELSTSAKKEAELESTGFENAGIYMEDFQGYVLNSESVEPPPDQIEECLNDLCIDGTTPDLDVLLDEALDKYGLGNSDSFYSSGLDDDDSVCKASNSVMSDLIQSTPLENRLLQTQYLEKTSQSHIPMDSKEDFAVCEYNATPISSAPSDVSETVEIRLESCLENSSDSHCSIQQHPIKTTNSQEHLRTSDMQTIPECAPSALAAKPTVASAPPKSQIKWNPMASAFYPASNPQSSFITPVVANPVQWTYVVRTRDPSGVISSNAHVPSASAWNRIPQAVCSAGNVKPMSQLKPKVQPVPQVSKKGTRLVGKVLVMLRGAPGSGKSTLARMLLEQNPSGVILSTDDYFYCNGQYQFDINCLNEAHDWNHKRAQDAFVKNVSPIIIDNTNMQGWEMKPYVTMAMKYKYKVTFREPDTWWKYKPKELERRNTHGVKKERIIRMLEHFERVTVNSILNLAHPKDPEIVTDKEDTSNICSNLSKQRPELLSFVGDWPVEQTLRQRSPRRKKKKPKNESVQQPTEEIQTAKCHLEQTFDHPKLVPYDDDDDDEIDFGDEASGTENAQNSSYTIHTSIEDNNTSIAEVKSKSESAVDMFFKILQQEPNSTLNERDLQNLKVDPEINPKPSSKRGCRQCKLALTFNNSCPSLPEIDDSLPAFKLTDAVDQSSSYTGVSQSSQTEPYDFAIAWRVERKNTSDIKSLNVLTGNGVRFKSKSLESSDHLQDNIPYRMVHHKSTFVEEDEISSLADEDGIQILCRLFRSLSFDVLKDLFERCNKDLQWATNLLLDSGEKMYKDEECVPEDWFKYQGESCEQSENCNVASNTIHQRNKVPTSEKSEIFEEQYKAETTSITDSIATPPENFTPSNPLSLVVAEELKNGNVLSSSSEVPELTNPCTVVDSPLPEHDLVSETVEAHIMWSSSLEGGLLNSADVLTNNIINEKTSKEHVLQGMSYGVDALCDTIDGQDEFPLSMCEDEENTDVQSNTKEAVKPHINYLSWPKESIKFDYLELSLPPELAFQLTELFGPVGIDPGALTIEDCVVPIDLKLAEEIHKKWKESIMERHNQEALSYQLLAEANGTQKDHIYLDSLLQEQESRLAEKYSVASEEEITPFPFMDQWNTQIKKVSLRQIMSEEMALQAREDLNKCLPSSNCAVKMKEKQLLELFPNVEQNLLIDIFKESNYSLEKTEEFMSCLLESDPVQNVVAPGFKQEVMLPADKTKEKKIKPDKDVLCERYFQDLEFPDYDDFRAEAFLYRQKQQESYRKAAEAHNRGMKQVAAYYAQQGYLYGQKMKEEHHRAAVHIFERANEYLLPENILDLHGLHVDEAMKHFRRVLHDKTEDYKQNEGKPHLLVITGRGNRSQGGVPRIKPAVVDYLTIHHYRFQEKTSGVLRITLKKN